MLHTFLEYGKNGRRLVSGRQMDIVSE